MELRLWLLLLLEPELRCGGLFSWDEAACDVIIEKRGEWGGRVRRML
jgi:hypothetical protein